MRIVNTVTGKTVASRVEVAETFVDRLAGLLARPPLKPGQGLLIRPCNGVHTWFMRYPIDVIFLDSDWTVVEMVRELMPFRFSRIVRRAAMALELQAGTIERTYTRVGDTLLGADGQLSTRPFDGWRW